MTPNGSLPPWLEAGRNVGLAGSGGSAWAALQLDRSVRAPNLLLDVFLTVEPQVSEGVRAAEASEWKREQHRAMLMPSWQPRF